MLKAGYFIAPRFQAGRCIGEGAFGSVHEAFDQERGELVALKSLTRLEPRALYQFKREFRLLRDLHDSNLVRLYELFAEEEHWYFTMELVNGCDLLSYVRPGEASSSSPSTVSRLDHDDSHLLDDAWKVPASPLDHEGIARLRTAMCGVVHGLDVLHERGIIHRDVKASNILVTHEGRAVLLDFGLAHGEEPRNDKTEDRLVGTPAYMAPELALGHAATGAADFYACGVLLYQCLTGRTPFRGNLLQQMLQKQTVKPVSPAELCPGTPRELSDLCDMLVAPRPSDRPKIAEILSTLRGRGATLTSRPPMAPPQGRERFVGRRDVLESLERAHGEVRAGRARMVELAGRSGYGKSTILREFCARARDSSVVLQGRCHQRESVPYKAFDTLMDALSHHLRMLDASACRALIPAHIDAVARLFPVLRRVRAIVDASEAEPSTGDVQVVRARAAGATRALLTSLGEIRPLVLVFDDVQWGDADSAWLLAELLAEPNPPNVMVVLAYREEEAHSSALLQELHRRLSRTGSGVVVERLAVAPLSTQEAEELAAQLLPDASNAAELARESLGIPLFLEELARHAETPGLREAANSNARERAGSAAQLGLDVLLRARVRKVPRAARTILEIVAVSGRATHRTVIVAASGESQGNVLAHVDHLVTAGLLRYTGEHGEWTDTFHDRVREAVRAEIDEASLLLLHQRMAQALGRDPSTEPEVLLPHLVAAGRLPEARATAKLAAERAFNALALDRAVSLYDEALALGGHGADELRALRIARADTLALAGRGVLAAEEWLELSQEAPAVQQIELRRRAADQLMLSGELARGMGLLREFMQDAGIALPATPLRALLLTLWHVLLWSVAGVRFGPTGQVSPLHRMRFDLSFMVAKAFMLTETLYAQYLTTQVVRLAKLSADARMASIAGASYAVTLTAIRPKRLEHALAQIQSAERLGAVSGSSEAIGFALGARAASQFVAGNFPACCESSDRTLSQLLERRVPSPWEVNEMVYFWCVAAARAGRYAELEKRLPGYLHAALERGVTFVSTTLRVSDATVLWLVRDDAETGTKDVEAALQGWGRATFDMQRFWGELSLIQLALYAGDVEQAASRMSEADRALRSSLVRLVSSGRAAASLIGARVALSRLALDPDSRVLRRAMQRAERRAVRNTFGGFAPSACLLRAGFAATRGEASLSRKLLEAALIGAERADLPHVRAFVDCHLRTMGAAPLPSQGEFDGHRWLTEQGVRNPARFLAAISPGFVRRV